MSPKSTTLLALIGVLLAGLPLPALTAARRQAPAPPEQAQPAAPLCPTYASLRWSGHPTQLHLLHEGRQLATLTPAELATTPCELELMLPPGGPADIEIIAQWPEGEQDQAVTLTLEPDTRPTQSATAWTTPGSPDLHSLLHYSW